MVAFKVSERRACRLIRLGRSTKRYRLRRDEQTALRIRLKELAAARPRYGYLRLHILLLREGWHINKKRVYRLYRQEGLELRHKKPKKRISALRVVPPKAKAPNECWSMDFVSDCLHDGRRFRALTIVDNVSRVSPAIEVGKISIRSPGSRGSGRLGAVSRPSKDETSRQRDRVYFIGTG